MIYFKKNLLLFSVFLIFYAQSTVRNQLHKNYVIDLPFYPTHCKVIKNDFTASNNPAKHIDLFLTGTNQELKNSSLLRCAVINNPHKNVTIPSSLISETLTLNKEPKQPNPLYDKDISLLGTFNQNPVVVTKQSPATICMLENFKLDQQTMLMTSTLCDAQGFPSAGIVGLATALTGTAQHELHPYVFAAVKRNEGTFGQEGSGIAVVKHDNKTIEETIKHNDGNETTNQRKEYFFTIMNNGDEPDQIKAASLINSSLSINGGIPIVADDIVDMCWNPYLERLYVALQVTNAPTNTELQGSRALLLGRIDSHERLVFDPIAPDDSFYTDNALIGACGSGKKISLHKVRSMLTSTGFPYLIVIGGVGEPTQTSKNIYALPLTDTSFNKKRVELMEDKNHGTIASKYSITGDNYIVLARGRKLYGRDYQEWAQSADQMPAMHDAAVKIGGTLELPNEITDVIICGDAIFVTIGQAGNGQYPGIFHSQAILDGQGRIVSWTAWQRVGGIIEGVRTAIINPEHHFFGYLPMDKPQLICKVQIDLSKTDSHNNDEYGDIADPINQFFAPEEGGVQGIFDFPCGTAGLGNQQCVSMMIATGYKKIMLLETGSNDTNGYFQPYVNQFTDIEYCPESTIPAINVAQEEPKVLALSGGVLDELGSILAAAIVTDGAYSWIAVGGMHGLAILQAADGTGWCSQQGLGTHFNGLNKPMAFRKIGAYKQIKKLIANGNQLYVLTNTSMERITLNSDVIQNNAVNSVRIAHEANNAFFDCVMYGPLAIIATAQGLFFNTSGSIVYNTLEEISWKKIKLPIAGVVSKIFAVSSKSHAGCQGQLYISVGALTHNSTMVYRLYVHDVYQEGITDHAVELIPDHQFFNKPFPLVSFNSFRDYFATDGAHYFSARSRHLNELPFLQAVTLPHIKNQLAIDAYSYTIPLYIGKSAKKINGIVQNSATGNWLIAGDFGLRIHN